MLVLMGGFHVGKDGKIHSEECCKIDRRQGPWSRTDKGFDQPMQFVSVKNWPLEHIPRVGEIIFLPDRSGDPDQRGQEVRVNEIAYRLPRVPRDLEKDIVEVWVGGWTHWEAQSVFDIFTYARGWVAQCRAQEHRVRLEESPHGG